MRHRITRRRALAGLSATAALPLLGCTNSRGERPDTGGSFVHGVASGDPGQHSVVLWTRLTTTAPRASGRWMLAGDERFAHILREGDFATDAARDWTVKVLADGLEPGRRYFYRFGYDGEVSPVGRTLTLADGHLERLGIAVVSCSNYPFGYFNAYETIALDADVDVVLHLGDYLYEYGPDNYGGETGRKLGRDHQPPREVVSLDEYRQRHAQYKADPQSRAVHAAHPFIAIWDDHESANNPWRDGAQNHQPDTEGDWQARRSASLQAYYEWMPVREPGVGMHPEQRWQHYRFGDLASLVTLETRHTARARQIEYGDYLGQLQSPEDAARFRREVLGAPGRDMLAPEMEAFLAASLRESVAAGRPWRLIGNQITMARVSTPPVTDALLAALGVDASHPLWEQVQRVRRLGELDLPRYTDPWDGYAWAREKFYATCRDAGAQDLLVLTGDTHSFWQNALFDERGDPVGLEIGTTAITSPSDLAGFGPEAAKRMDPLLAGHNREVLWTEGETNGYVRLVLAADGASVDYVGVSDILGREYRPLAVRQVRILREAGRLGYA